MGTEKFADFEALSIQGERVSMQAFAQHVVLVVNVASRCGFTKQYAGLQQLYTQYQKQGLVILGFPCNQFGGQEPEDEPAIAAFCAANYGVTFPLFAKVAVNGKDTHPLFAWLKVSKTGWAGTARIGWNFTKFLINRSGDVVGRWSSRTTPESLAPEIERWLSVPV